MRAIVIGAISGIGKETVKALSGSGWEVIAVARRADKLKELSEETESEFIVGDITKIEDLDNIVSATLKSGNIDALVNVAGIALGVDSIADGSSQDWLKMFQTNVLAAFEVTQRFLPALRANGFGTVLHVTSTAATVAYEGGGGYVAAKHAQKALLNTLRLEEAENNIRVIDIAPGMVKTDEFSLKRLKGDRLAADNVYSGVDKPLLAEDIAQIIAFSLNLPHHINIDNLVVRPVVQAAQHKVIRI